MATSKRQIFVLNGPNLDILGRREPKIYEPQTLKDLQQLCRSAASSTVLELVFEQSNAEHVKVKRLIERLSPEPIYNDCISERLNLPSANTRTISRRSSRAPVDSSGERTNARSVE